MEIATRRGAEPGRAAVQLLGDLVAASFNLDRSIDGVACYSVTAQHPKSGRATEFRIEKDSLLLRKLIELGELPHEQVRDHIRVDEPLSDSLFEAV
jgi:hypothetical protein